MLVLSIDRFRVVRNTRIDLGTDRIRVLLYGPNGSGKSSIIYTLLMIVNEHYVSELLGYRGEKAGR